jgi:methylated-DNA-[protein]-cysteine S-methyltransferase
MTETLTIETRQTPLGDLLVVTDPHGRLHATEFADCEARVHRLLRRRLGTRGYRLAQGQVPAAISQALDGYFAGDLSAIRDVPVHKGGTTFQETVWSALHRIEPGRPINYATLARSIGRPDAARAVGHANGSNPNCIVVPCHRLVGADGALTGYAGGLTRKRWLLDHEARHAHS